MQFYHVAAAYGLTVSSNGGKVYYIYVNYIGEMCLILSFNYSGYYCRAIASCSQSHVEAALYNHSLICWLLSSSTGSVGFRVLKPGFTNCSLWKKKKILHNALAQQHNLLIILIFWSLWTLVNSVLFSRLKWYFPMDLHLVRCANISLKKTLKINEDLEIDMHDSEPHLRFNF